MGSVVRVARTSPYGVPDGVTGAVIAVGRRGEGSGRPSAPLWLVGMPGSSAELLAWAGIGADHIAAAQELTGKW